MATTADVCADPRCGHTRYNHDPSGRTGPVNRCRVDVNYHVPPCPCEGFQESTDLT